MVLYYLVIHQFSDLVYAGVIILYTLLVSFLDVCSYMATVGMSPEQASFHAVHGMVRVLSTCKSRRLGNRTNFFP